MDEKEGAQVLALLREYSFWFTEQLERAATGEHNPGTLELVKKLREDKQVDLRVALRVVETYLYLRNLHFARRKNGKIAQGLFLDLIADWTPPGWVYNCFPLPTPGREIVTLGYVVDAMHEETDRCTEWDGTPLGRVLHVAHMLVCFQGADGLWPGALNLRTGEEIGTERSSAPRNLMRRLNNILGSTEFDFAIRRCEAGISAQKTK